MEGLLIRRTLELDCPADELWRLVSEPDEVASWLGRDVVWSGQRLRVLPDGRMLPLDAGAEPALTSKLAAPSR